MSTPHNVEVRTPALPDPGDLYVGACYQPVDRTASQIQADIALMKYDGFNAVRMGHLTRILIESHDEVPCHHPSAERL